MRPTELYDDPFEVFINSKKPLTEDPLHSMVCMTIEGVLFEVYFVVCYPGMNTPEGFDSRLRVRRRLMPGRPVTILQQISSDNDHS